MTRQIYYYIPEKNTCYCSYPFDTGTEQSPWRDILEVLNTVSSLYEFMIALSKIDHAFATTEEVPGIRMEAYCLDNLIGTMPPLQADQILGIISGQPGVFLDDKNLSAILPKGSEPGKE